ncbi:NUDIX hydrolase [Parasedimentitalea maritima]|uniref:NUDIX domain-containing protein n=1 Tax=Parasedimentitalea maritima TaxID=2578117 RepID=A0A6A4RI91_9RHOB|nr:NUDIX hydrolase [Zongyanglinia marina]KAE9630881.1 NUDIX domain-containing protein [Zongyanglinia marina]
MIRRFGEPPEPGRHYHRRPGVYALLPRNGQFLLTCQYDPDPDIQLPGGGIDPGESPLPALHREVHEETGWSISTPQKFGIFRRFVYMPEYDLWAEKLCHIYVARPVQRIAPPREKNHEAIWTDASDAVSQLGNPGDRFFAAQLNRLKWHR